MRTIQFYVVLALATASLAMSATAQSQFNIQGSLQNKGGPVPDGNYGLTIRLFDAEIDGNLLHEESYGAANAIVISNGLFSLKLGSLKPMAADLFQTNKTVWLEVQVELETPLPRKQLGSVPLAYEATHASVADTLSGPATDLECTGCVGSKELGFEVYSKNEINAQIDALAQNVYTKAEVEDHISAAVALSYSKAETDAKLSKLVSDAYSKAEVDKAMNAQSAALSDLASKVYTKIESDQAINQLKETVNKNQAQTATAIDENANKTAAAIDELAANVKNNKDELTTAINTATADTNAAMSALSKSVYTKAETDAAISSLSKSVYTKAETDAAISSLSKSVYTKGETDAAISALSKSVYTKAEIDAKLNSLSSQLSQLLPLSGGTISGSLTVKKDMLLGAGSEQCTASNKSALRWNATLVEACDGTQWRGLAYAADIPAVSQVFSEVGPSSQNPTVTLGTISGIPGKSIQISKLGICGDSDSGSGPNRFRINGGGLDVTWSAGQNNNAPATHILSPTPVVSGSARGFSYKNVSHSASVGASITVTWNYHYDWDGRYCETTDTEGNQYNDSASSVRAWVLYKYK